MQQGQITSLLATLFALAFCIGSELAYGEQKKKANRSSRKAPTRSSPVTPGNPSATNIGVRQMFAEAQKKYDAARYPEALAIYDAILRKYPGHEPSSVQYAKTLYRMDRIQESYAMFARINPQYFDAETSYEYGWAFYINKQYEGALYGFQRVPPGHALFDLANYYGGICAIKLKKYADAEEMFEKAVVLPDKLAKSRVIYLKHAQELRLMNDKNQLTKERNAEKRRLSSESQADGQKADSSTKKDPNAPYAHSGFLGTTRAASLNFTQSNKTNSYHGFKTGTSTTKVGTFTFLHGPIIPLPIKDSSAESRQAAVGLQLMAIAEDRQKTGQEQRIIIEEDNRDIVRYQTTDLGKSHSQLGIVSASPWIEFPLAGNLWIGFSGNLAFSYPEFGRAGRTGSKGGTITTGVMMPQYTVTANIDHTQNLNTKTQAESAITSTTLGATYAFPANLSAKMNVGYKYYDYVETTLDGPDGVTFGSMELKQKFPLGFSLAGFGAFEQQTNYIFHSIPTYGVVAANGQVATGKLTLGLAPFPWISASLSQLFQQTTWSIDQGDSQSDVKDTFEKNVANYVSDLAVGVTINFAF